MKYGFLSDCHGNFEGLKRATDLLKLKGVQQLICLGDVVGYGPESPKCIEFLQDNFHLAIAGNHDHALLEKMSMSLYQDYAIEAILYTRNQLREKHKKYLSKMPMKHVIQDGDVKIFLSHAHPSDYESWCYHPTDPEFHILNEDEENLFGLCFFGHTHQARFAVTSKQGELQVPENYVPYSFEDFRGHTLVINVGSCGQPRDSDTRVCAVVLDTTAREFEFLRGEYNVEATQNSMLEAGLNSFLIERLNYGR